jgi:hypothetical protein
VLAQRGEGRCGTVGAGKAVVGDEAGALGFPTPRVSEIGLRTGLGAKNLGDDGRGGSALDLEPGVERVVDGLSMEIEGALPLPSDCLASSRVRNSALTSLSSFSLGALEAASGSEEAAESGWADEECKRECRAVVFGMEAGDRIKPGVDRAET